MKEVPKKDVIDVSGGQFQDSGCIPLPEDYPRNPSNPIDPPILDLDPAQT
jgi:hypothetical protein